MPVTPAPYAARELGWTGELELGFARTGEGATILDRRLHRGPLQVQRPFFPEGHDLCHVYVLHPPGGIVSGDALHIRATVDPGARVLLTTPAATKVYRGRGNAQDDHTLQTQRFRVGAGASLEWLPQETILFEQARISLETHVHLEKDARFLGWEILCFGRPAAGEGFTRGLGRQRFELWRDGRPLAIERSAIEGGSLIQRAPWGLANQSVVGTLLASPAALDEAALDDLRALAPALPAGDQATVSTLDGALVCRYLGPSAERARAHFVRVWERLRPTLIGRPPAAPRIWKT